MLSWSSCYCNYSCYKIFSYLDKYYTLNNNVTSLKDLGRLKFQRILDPSTEVGERTKQAVSDIIRQDRDVGVDETLLATCLEPYGVVLSGDVRINVFHECIELPYLEVLKSYYSDEFFEGIVHMSTDIEDFLNVVSSTLAEERIKLEKYRIRESIAKKLLAQHFKLAALKTARKYFYGYDAINKALQSWAQTRVIDDPDNNRLFFLNKFEDEKLEFFLHVTELLKNEIDDWSKPIAKAVCEYLWG